MFGIHPYSSKSFGVVISLIVIYLSLYAIPTTLNPWFPIPLRSLLILGLFCIPLFVFRWSSDIEDLVKRTDLEEETIVDVRKILSEEFEESK